MVFFVVFPGYVTHSFPRRYCKVLEKNDRLLLYFQHAHFIPIVGVGKERRTLIGPW